MEGETGDQDMPKPQDETADEPEGLKEKLGPKVDELKAKLGPKVEEAGQRLAPKLEKAKGAIGQAVSKLREMLSKKK